MVLMLWINFAMEFVSRVGFGTVKWRSRACRDVNDDVKCPFYFGSSGF